MLSERDQRRLEEGRKEAAIKMAKERRRIAEEKELAAETERIAAQRRKDLGIHEVTGPDGSRVLLTVQPTGVVGGLGFGGGDDLVVMLLLLPVMAVVFGFSWIGHKVVFGGGHTVHAAVIGSRTVKFREPSKAAARQRLHLLAAEIERAGAGALNKQ
jgi:hypothetical protein